MKIGILTQALGFNYGGILQNYALQTILREMGHEPYTIDYEYKMSPDDYPHKLRMYFVNRLLMRRHGPYPLKPCYGRAVHKLIGEFMHQNITLTDPKYTISKELLDSYQFDALISGSDQNWRPLCNPKFLYDMYMEFAQGYNLKRISYASSFGASEREYSTEQIERCKPLARKFDAISVRENSGTELCKAYFDVEAKWVLDPTLLLTKEHYSHLCRERHQENNAPYLLAYVLDKSSSFTKALKRLSKELNVNLIVMRADKSLDNNSSVEGWLSAIRDAKYVVTDSFHGTIFSIIFGRNFLTIRNSFRGGGRFDSLAQLLAISDRITDFNGLSTEAMAKTIDWHQINRNIEAKRTESLSFLTNALK